MTSPAEAVPDTIVRQAFEAGATLLSEGKSFSLCESLGIAVARRIVVKRPEDVERLVLDRFSGDCLVVKTTAAGIAHKSEHGGVEVCNKNGADLEQAVARMHERFEGQAVSVHEHIVHDRSIGSELLIGLQLTADYGPVITLGLGGVNVERLSAWEPLCLGDFGRWQERLRREVGSHPLTALLTTEHRGGQRQVADVLTDLLKTLLARAGQLMPPLVEFEINPLVISQGRPVALDVLARVGGATQAAPVDRPLHKIGRLLQPQSIAIAGVSRRSNPGRVILENILQEGFPPDKLTVIKPGAERIAGCRVVASPSQLAQPVDLLVLAVEAAGVPKMVEEAIAARRAEGIILIPGGLGEHRSSEQHRRRIETAISDSRGGEWQGPVVNGGNCLGVRSQPGRYDTLFIPRHKLSFGGRPDGRLALISQSGAFAVSKASKLWSLNPRYVISVGNQIDLTMGDYLTYLADDQEVGVFACYVEGFRYLDGARFLAAAEKIAGSGRPVILYRAGRTPAGVEAAVSHTAAVAGSYLITRQLATQAGVLVMEELEQFEELVRTCCLLEGRELGGNRIGAMSNAGFESVAMADRLGSLQLAELSPVTRRRLSELVESNRLGEIVTVRNPLDVTPIFGDESFAEAARALLSDDGVDLAVLGCVPLTPALQTLPSGGRHREDVEAAGAITARLQLLWQQTSKPWAVVVDGGPPYDSMARRLELAGIPTFRNADRALGALQRYASWRLDRVP